MMQATDWWEFHNSGYLAKWIAYGSSVVIDAATDSAEGD